MSVNDVIMQAMRENSIDFVTTVPCKQLAGVIEKIEQSEDIRHVPANREDEGMGLCAGAYMGGAEPAIIMQNTAIGVTINALATLIGFTGCPANADQLSRRGGRACRLSGRDGGTYEGAVKSAEYPDLSFPPARRCRRNLCYIIALLYGKKTGCAANGCTFWKGREGHD